MLIDVSHHQGAIDWTKADPVIDGAYIKITEGTTYVDPAWTGYHAGATAGGRPVGAYHFADGRDPVAEANHFADVYLTAEWQLDPVLDAEVPAITPAWIVAFRAQFRARIGRARFRVYTSYGYLNGQLNPKGWIDPDTTIWAARYAPVLGWTHPQLVLWQNTDAATIPGVLGSVDADQYMNGWTPGDDMTDPLNTQITRQGTQENGSPQTGQTDLAAVVAWFDSNIAYLARKIDAIPSAVQSEITAEQAAVVAAIQAIPAGQAPTDAQMQALTAAVVAALPGYTVQITPTGGTA